MIKKTIGTVICLLMGLSTLLAQADQGNIRVNGRILIEGTTDDIPFATITVQNDKSQVITRLAADDRGRFTFRLKDAGAYDLILSAVGFSAAPNKITIEANETVKDLGNIFMKEGIELSEVSIAVQRPLIKSDPDKLVYSVEADPEAQSSTLQEIIRKVPLLTIDSDDNVTLNGQSNYKVLVNGKSSTLMSNNFKEVIKSMPANSIRDIEVITNPSSKYEAEGVGGIINIITARRTTDGYTGSVGANVDSRGSLGANAYIAANIDKFSFSTRIFANQFKQPESGGFSNRITYENVNDYKDKIPNRYVNTVSANKYKQMGSSITFEAGYEIDSLNLISASAWGYLGNFNNNATSMNETLDGMRELISRFQNKSNYKNQWGYLSGNIDYQRSYLKKDKTLTASYKIDYTPDNYKNENELVYELIARRDRLKTENKSSGQNHTFQLDYFDPLTDKHQLETGIKAMYRLNFSETERFIGDATSDNWILDTSRPNDLDYNQYIMGVYAGYLIKLKKISLKGGMRSEYTWNDGTLKTTERKRFDNSFFNFIPYINFTYAIKPTQTIKTSYTQRLFRPGIYQLNPYVNDANPLEISYGNPDLVAEISHSFSASYGHFSPKFNINIEFSSSFANNSIQWYTFTDGNGILNRTYGNMGSNQRHGISVYGSWRPNRKLSFNVNGNGMYRIIEAAPSGNYKLHNEGIMGYTMLGGRYEAWKGGAITANGYAMFGSIMLQGKSSNYYSASIGITQKLLKDKMDVGLYFSDPFTRKIYFKTTIDKDPSFSSYSEQYRWGQTARMSVTYRFGKMNTQVKKAKRGIQNEEQSGGGGQEGGGGGGQTGR
jgi:outer membrane cobalamin receptor